ncbi:helix-turn-helix and ligand-binding sensor domain-containing protein [Flavobacterium cyclinae]|uniref:helix-turn-helix and ligand-binding sensor domain-containing protein n=1 Tax=Flavobacterium cyclinae TaxID=2895947 RepID=UPI001E49A83C|nr:triple tyrosine motif-containing protein [Flavobacterium cyclinae]UGS20122.1 LuxR family transcriptional regulator [Flavobacterium cyclinae]
MQFSKTIFKLFLALFSLFGLAQQLPPIVKYSKEDYKAGIQNWMISQDNHRFMYFANNEGLLEFNGSKWILYPSPNETIIRSVKCINDVVYTGSFMEFGFWKRAENGQLVYTSLSHAIKDKINDDEQFWGIFPFDNWILFQSLEKIYAYNTKTKLFTIINPNSTILKAFQTVNTIYFQTNKGLYEIDQGKSKLFLNNEIINQNKIITIFDTNNGLLLVTQKKGIFKYQNGILSKFFTNIDAEIEQSNIYSCQILSDQSIALGSISNGVFILSKEGNLIYHITQNSGLSNNTALSLFEDLDKNLWIGLDNGINCLNIKSPIKNYLDNTGILGTIYTSITHNNKLYIGTNQGLFCKDLFSSAKFEFVKNTKGQVWNLFSYQNTLFCGHDSGTFIVNDGVANLIYSASGTWKFVPSTVSSNLILQGNYNGISVLEKKNNNWVFRNKINGFNYSSKHFEILNSKEVFVSHEYKGVYRFTIDSQLTSASNIFKYKNPEKGKNASLIKYNDHIYYASKAGVFKMNNKTKSFDLDSSLSSMFQNDEYVTGKMIVDKSNKLWFFTKHYIYYYSAGKLTPDLKRNSLPIPSSLTNSMPGYENILQLEDDNYLIGTTDGFYILKNNDFKFNNYKVSIFGITNNSINEKSTNVSIQEEGSFDYDDNNLAFYFAVPEYDKYINAEYQYKLEGLHEEWSDWSFNSQVFFENLPSGNYLFSVRAKVANSMTDNIATYSFEINKPWYANNFAMFIYFILLIILAFYIHKFYTIYHEKRHQKIIAENNMLLELKELENEQQIMKIKNEQLAQDVDKKNKELAVTNMNLIKKTELLNIIKADLKNSTDSSTNRSIKSVISTINKNVKEENTWNIFKEAFDSADNNFLKKVKENHPTLTPNDLRLCAYLRLNLSSKEIAPLLNISVRSIEIKRYRLRKKMNLPHETGLVEYLLSI